MIDFKTLPPGMLGTLLRPYTSSLSGNWYRAIQSKFISTPLAWHHTRRQRSRFGNGASAKPAHPLLYLAENHFVALLEVAAIFNPPGSRILVPYPGSTWMALSVSVSLSKIVNLTDRLVQQKLETNAQELTGDWVGYELRTLPGASVPLPTGDAPTQELAAAMYKELPDLQGFLTLSAKAPDRKNLILFPDRIISPSSDYVEFVEPLNDGTTKTHRIP